MLIANSLLTFQLFYIAGQHQVGMNDLHLKTGVESDTGKALAQRLRKDYTDIVRVLSQAAVIGEKLNQRPRCHDSRVSAKGAWKAIRGILNPNLTAEQRPHWVKEASELPTELISELEAQLRRIHFLIVAVASVEFEFDSDARVREGGRALRELVIVLDHIIAGGGRRLLPYLDSLIFRVQQRNAELKP